MATAAYNRGKFLLASAGIDWANDDVQVLLLDNAAGSPYVFSADHNFVSDVVAAELSGVANYVRKSLGAKTVTENDTDDQAEWGAADPVWSELGACEVQAVVLFKQVTNDADSPLIGYIDGATYPATHGGTGDFTAKFNGIVATI